MKKGKGVLYSRNVNGNWRWYKSRNDKKGTKCVGEIENGEPNGQGNPQFILWEVYRGIQEWEIKCSRNIQLL